MDWIARYRVVPKLERYVTKRELAPPPVPGPLARVLDVVLEL